MQLDYRDHVTELLTTIGACGIAFDITVNYDLTKLYLEVVGLMASACKIKNRWR
jgi:Membrane-associated apoptosis protein